MITMAIDHIGSPILGNYLPFRRIGRFAFPIYTFLLAEGFRHIKGDENRVMKHLSGYILLALVSEAAYDLLEASALTAEAMFESQSVMVTLLLSLLGLMAFDKFRAAVIIGCTALALRTGGLNGSKGTINLWIPCCYLRFTITSIMWKEKATSAGWQSFWACSWYIFRFIIGQDIISVHRRCGWKNCSLPIFTGILHTLLPPRCLQCITEISVIPQNGSTSSTNISIRHIFVLALYALYHNAGIMDIVCPRLR